MIQLNNRKLELILLTSNKDVYDAIESNDQFKIKGLITNNIDLFNSVDVKLKQYLTNKIKGRDLAVQILSFSQVSSTPDNTKVSMQFDYIYIKDYTDDLREVLQKIYQVIPEDKVIYEGTGKVSNHNNAE